MAKIIKTLFVFLLFFSMAGESSALTISPPVREVGGDPGVAVQGILKIYNETSQEVVVYPSLASFSAKEEGNGEPEISFFDRGEKAEGLASWIKMPEGPFVVKPLDWQNVIFEIDIPRNAEPGGHYAGIFFSPNKNQTGDRGKVSVDYKTGTLLLLSVSGDIKQNGNLKSLGLKGDKTFYDHVPVGLELRIENSGNVHFKPAGGIEIKNIFSKKVDELPLIKTATGGNVLPGSTRRYDISWGEFEEKNIPEKFWDKVKFEWKNFRFGKYTALATVGLPSGLSESRALTFWIIPWQLLLIIILGLVAVVTLFRWYNRWIIRKAREGK